VTTPAILRTRARRVAARVIASRPAYRPLSLVPSTALLVARAAFRTGRDDILRESLDRLAARDRDGVMPLLLRADMLTFHGRYQEAFAHARRAADRDPGSAGAAARTVRLGYRVLDRAEAEAAAVAAVGRFPRSTEVMWAASMACDNPAQYARVASAWRAAAGRPLDLLRVVRQLAVAAARAGELEAATGWYREAIAHLLDGVRPPAAQVTRLGGLGALGAIRDLCRVLDRAGIPFFFAAGTALGLVRDRRPLGEDGDIDVGIFESDWRREALIELFTADPMFDLDLHPQSEKVGLRHRGGSPVDIFRFYEEDGRLWHDGVFVRWHNSPFQVVRRRIGRLEVPLPADADRYLTESYGDWRTRRPSFDAFTDDAPNIEVTWPEYQRMHFVRRAYQLLVRGDRAAAVRELTRAGEDRLSERVRSMSPTSPSGAG
jgi:tetratricopeptide (TPR) repeat protein